MINKALSLDPTDNVGVALTDLESGQSVSVNGQNINLIDEKNCNTGRGNAQAFSTW